MNSNEYFSTAGDSQAIVDFDFLCWVALDFRLPGHFPLLNQETILGLEEFLSG